MGTFAYWFASGQGYIAGFLLIATGAALSFFDRRQVKGKRFGSRTVSCLAMVIGFLLLLFASAPISGVFFRILGILSLALIFLSGFESKSTRLCLYLIRFILIGLSIFIVLGEWGRQRLPRIPEQNFETLYIIGDSLSAGIGFPGEKTWIDIIHEQYPELQIVPFTVGGAGLDYALEHAGLICEENAIVILEIGGNDVLRKMDPSTFSARLRALFDILCRQNRTVIMFELPLPPFANQYGQIQRTQAARYRVRLIPRQVLAALITGDNTCDGLHLSNAGHRKMASVIRQILLPSDN